MLEDLYNYALKRNLSARPGFKMKTVNAYILLSADGEYLGIENADKEKVMAPDIGAAARGTLKCNFPLEKVNIIFNQDENKKEKSNFYRMAATEAVKYENSFARCLDIIDNDKTIEKILIELTANKIKPADFVTFKVDGRSVVTMESYYDWWNNFRCEQTGDSNNNRQSDNSRCFITGELSEPLETVPPVSGLKSVGGHSNGDSLICFDKDAFCSYDLKQAANATVSEEAMTTVNSALYELIGKAPIHAGAKLLHWYKEPVANDEDFFNILDIKFGADNTSDNDEDDKAGDVSEKDEFLAEAAADKLLHSLQEGKRPIKLGNRYYLLSLSGAGGRVMIRYYMQGSYEDLYDSFRAWYDDLNLINKTGNGMAYLPKLGGIYFRLLKKGGNQNLRKRMATELSGIDSQIMFAIINNSPLPDSVATRALSYIRSDMFEPDEKTTRSKKPDTVCCQILKTWLNRRKREINEGAENMITEELNPDYTGIAYQTGRMMAVYAAIQQSALGDVGAGVVQRYYTSAGTSPALVMGRLGELSMHHLSKLGRGLEVLYSRMINEVSLKITQKYPPTFSLSEKSEYALGYYHQSAYIEKHWKDKAIENKIQNTNNQGGN